MVLEGTSDQLNEDDNMFYTATTGHKGLLMNWDMVVLCCGLDLRYGSIVLWSV